MAKFIVCFNVTIEVEAKVSPETQDELDNVFVDEDVIDILPDSELNHIIDDALSKVVVGGEDVKSIYYVAEED